MLTVRKSRPRTAKLMHAMEGHGPYQQVTAVATLDDELFVAWVPSDKGIYVYDTNTFTLQRHIPLDALHLAACAYHKCLYVATGYNSIVQRYIVHRVVLSWSPSFNFFKQRNDGDVLDYDAVKQWPVSIDTGNHVGRLAVGQRPVAGRHGPTWLSVSNESHNFVVTCGYARKIQIYTADGSLVRHISLSLEREPRHAVQLSNGQLVVSYLFGPISVVTVDGQVVRNYCRPESLAELGHMKDPRGLAVTKNGIILFADETNRRILTMDSSLSSVEALSLPVADGTFEPSGLCLDESLGRLYVGERGAQNRLLVFKCNDSAKLSKLINI